MTMNCENFPIVWMSFADEPGHDHDDELADFEELLSRGRHFVILTQDPPSNDHEHSKEEKKRTALWMKRHKIRLRILVLAMIVVEENTLKRAAIKSFAPGFGAFWGFSIIAATNRNEALSIASRLLSDS
ncbi:hypothetical protein ASG32_23275 [Methylobacterium sp. Leaf361]|nr:hypothetical protein ASG32_23275 [Methylobacterium sp. Leaf361]